MLSVAPPSSSPSSPHGPRWKALASGASACARPGCAGSAPIRHRTTAQGSLNTAVPPRRRELAEGEGGGNRRPAPSVRCADTSPANGGGLKHPDPPPLTGEGDHERSEWWR